MMTKAALVDGRTDVGVLPTGQVVGTIDELPTVASSCPGWSPKRTQPWSGSRLSSGRPTISADCGACGGAAQSPRGNSCLMWQSRQADYVAEPAVR